MCGSVVVQLPEWVSDFVQTHGRQFQASDQQMSFAIGLARENITRKTGGPFGAAVFECGTGNLISCGVNIVVPSACSVNHAEAVALMYAQKEIGSHTLAGDTKYRLVTSAQMCIMCYGITYWSGVSEVLIGANAKAVEQITGFDEGPMPDDWEQKLLDKCGGFIGQTSPELIAESEAVLRTYAESGGTIYNP